MDKLTVREIAEATGGKLLCGDENYVVDRVCTDSREAGENDVFFPLKGERFDAHDFLPQVIENGCRVLVVSNMEAAEKFKDREVILTDDTQKALQNLAKWYIRKLNLKVIGVTGSVGKTSTRDFIYAGMSKKYVTGTNKKNFNNQIGLPLTVLELTSEHEAAVLEMGMDRKGEIHALADIARPDVAVITNIGISHIEHLGSREGIRDAKLEITDYFGSENTLIINGNDEYLGDYDFADSYNVISTGLKDDRYRAENLIDHGAEGIEFDLFDGDIPHHVKLNQPGAHNAVNMLFAAAACAQFGVCVSDVVEAAENVAVTGNRLRIKDAGSIKIIDDSYNAAPASMKSAIETLKNTSGERKVAVLGDMYELGSDTEELHRDVGRFAAENDVDVLIGAGSLGCRISEGAEEKASEKMTVMSFENVSDLILQLGNILESGDVVLVKASRGLELEKVSSAIIELGK